MKIICTQENLRTGLQTVARIISPSNTLPILNNILIKTENGLLKISSTNLEIAITTQIRCKVEEEGEITVYSKTITDLINNLPNKNITLQTKNNELIVETEHYHTSVKTLPAEEFPLIPQIESREVFTVEAQELKKAVDQVVFAVSTNQTQPEISGVLMNLEGKQMVLVATDRYRLAEKKIELVKKVDHEQQVIIPQKTLVELSRIIGGQTDSVEVVLNETQISLVISQTQIISRLIDGQYPDYKQIVPTVFPTMVTTSRTALVNALRASGIFSQSSNSISLEYNQQKQELVVTSESVELGKGVVNLPSQVEGESGVVILNYHYVLDCLGGIGAENIVIKIINDSSPTIIVPEDQKDYMYLVMPIKS